MKTFLLTSAAVFGLFGASALASDLPTKAPAYKTPIAAPPYNWSGFYVGANFGAGWTTGSLNIPGNNFYGGTTEFIGASRPVIISRRVIFYLASKAISIGRVSIIPPFRFRRQVL